MSSRQVSADDLVRLVHRATRAPHVGRRCLRTADDRPRPARSPCPHASSPPYGRPVRARRRNTVVPAIAASPHHRAAHLHSPAPEHGVENIPVPHRNPRVGRLDTMVHAGRTSPDDGITIVRSVTPRISYRMVRRITYRTARRSEGVRGGREGTSTSPRRPRSRRSYSRTTLAMAAGPDEHESTGLSPGSSAQGRHRLPPLLPTATPVTDNHA